MDDATFWDGVARNYAARPVRDEAAYAATQVRIRHHLPPGARVLELGCGTGTTALKLHDAAGSWRATDISPEMIAIAREKPGSEAVDFAVGTAADEPEGAYDAVMAFSLLHLVPDAGAEIARIARLLAPGGLFISKTMCLADGTLVMRVLLPAAIAAMRLFGKAPKVRSFAKAELEGMVREAGFEIVETGDYPDPAHFIVARKL